MGYSVIERPIVLVIDQNDVVQELSFREVFEKAHLLKDIGGDSPLDRYAMFRLLLAFSMDMLKLKTWRDRKQLLEYGSFDMTLFDTYVQECEKNGPCFDILDSEKPFMQARFNETTDADKIKSVAKLSSLLPQGNNHMLWDHRPEQLQTMSMQRAFRAMVGLYLFCTAQGQGFPSPVNNTTPVYTIVKGENLFRTIVLNMLAKGESEPIPYGEGWVPWRNFANIQPKQEVVEISLLEALTWQPRRITLKCEDGKTITNVWLQQGKNFKGNGVWADPYVPRFCSKKGEWLTLKPQPQRALWRDLGTLLLDSSGSKYKPPVTISQYVRMTDENVPFISIYEMGLVTNQASYVEIMEDELSVPVFLLKDADKSAIFNEDVTLVENVQHTLGYFITHNIPDSANLEKDMCSYFLSLMHDRLFGEIITILNETDPENAESLGSYLRFSGECLIDAIRKTVHDVLEQTGTTVQNMQQQLLVSDSITGYCYKVLKERKETYGL